MVAQAPEPIFSTGLVASFAARHAVVDLVATAVQHIGRTAILAAPVAPCDDCIGGSEAPAAVSGQILVDHQCRFEVVSGMARGQGRSEEHTSELQSLMRISYAVFCLKKIKLTITTLTIEHNKIINNRPTHICTNNQK